MKPEYESVGWFHPAMRIHVGLGGCTPHQRCGQLGLGCAWARQHAILTAQGACFLSVALAKSKSVLRLIPSNDGCFNVFQVFLHCGDKKCSLNCAGLPEGIMWV